MIMELGTIGENEMQRRTPAIEPPVTAAGEAIALPEQRDAQSFRRRFRRSATTNSWPPEGCRAKGGRPMRTLDSGTFPGRARRLSRRRIVPVPRHCAGLAL